MSGPKVVRIVTREEMLSRCQGLLTRLDAALADWTRQGRRHGTVSETELAAAARRRDEIAALIQANRFTEFQKAVPTEMAFLQADQTERLHKLALAKAQARAHDRRRQDAAGALLTELRRRDRPLTPALERALSDAANGRGDAAAALRSGFDLLAVPSAGDSARLQALAQSLKDGSPARSLDDWLASQPPDPQERTLRKLEETLAEAEGHCASEAVRAFDVRLARIRETASGAQRSLLIDSLTLDAAQAVRTAQRLGQAWAKFAETAAEWRAALGRDPEALPETDSLAEINSRTEGLEREIERFRAAAAAEARRQAVLSGLAALGYEAGAELSTTWVRDGHLVLKRPAQPGYGIELGGGAEAERLQLRVVAFGEGPADAARDRDAETLWCGDVSTLQARLAAQGGGLTIEKALAVGATPVKRVPAAEDRTIAREGRAPTARELR